MKIGFLLPSNYAVGNPGCGVLAQASYQAAALERLGHEVLRLNPWHPQLSSELDVIHAFQSGQGITGIENLQRESVLALSPIIDSNQSYWAYRLAASFGKVIPRIDTIPGIVAGQAASSDAIIVRSEHEKLRLIRSLRQAEHKVYKVLNGVDSVKKASNANAVARLNLPEKFLLHVSAYTQERKNVHRLIQAVGPLGYPLIIAGYGAQTNQAQKIEKIAAEFHHIKILPYLSDADLAELYQAAHAFCLPSHHEGTGLTALEAAAHGCGVMITQNGGTADYFEDLAQYVDPNSVESIRTAAQRLWNCSEYRELQNHVSETLSWDNSAISLIDAYQDAISRKY